MHNNRTGFAPQPGEATGPDDRYQASDIYNDSSVAGDNVKEALDELSNTTAGIDFREETRVVTAAEIAGKAMNLSSVPKQDMDIEFTIDGAAPNMRNINFIVSGSSINWNNTIIDGILEEGDTVSVKYYI